MSKLTGQQAIDYARDNGTTLNKYADPTEEAREGLTADEAQEVASEDPELIWTETTLEAPGDCAVRNPDGGV